MPYDNQGRWYPSADIGDVGGGLWNNNWDATDIERHLRTQVKPDGTPVLRGDQTLHNLFTSEEWRDISQTNMVKVLHRYQDEYHGDLDWDVNADYWGMDLERRINSSDDIDEWTDANIYQALMGKKSHRKGADYKIDFAHYNDDPLFRSAVKEMSLSKEFGKDLTDKRTPFSTAGHIREAIRIVNTKDRTWDKEWVTHNATAYTDEEIEARTDFSKFNISRHWDPATNVTTYINPQDPRSLSTKLYEAHQAGNYYQLQQPAQPQSLNIVAGQAPEAEYDETGNRLVTDQDIADIYQRYWDRTREIVGDDVVTIPEDTQPVRQWEIDHWREQIDKNKWDYTTFEKTISQAPEATGDKGRLFYNPNAGKEAKIREQLVDEPTLPTPPSLTIRKLKGGVKSPANLDSPLAKHQYQVHLKGDKQ